MHWMIRNVATVRIPGCLGWSIALFASTLREEESYARIKVELRIEPELSRSEVAVLLKSPFCGYCCLSTSFHSFSVILSRLDSTHQDLSGAVKVVDGKQEPVELHLSKVSLLFKFSNAYSPRPSKEIVAHCHYSPARLTVTDCFSQWLVSCLFPLLRIVGNLLALEFCWRSCDRFLDVFFLLEFKSGWKGIDFLCIRVISVDWLLWACKQGIIPCELPLRVDCIALVLGSFFLESYFSSRRLVLFCDGICLFPRRLLFNHSWESSAFSCGLLLQGITSVR